MQELKVKSQNGKRKRDAAGLLYSVFCILTTVFLFGCSASAPPQNPYSCPTDPSFTIPTYCKPGKDPLLNTSIGQSWPVPFTYYLYTENSTDLDAGLSSASPKIYQINQNNAGDYCTVPGIPVSVPAGPNGCSDVGGSNAPPPNFTTSTNMVLAEYDSATTLPPSVTLGVFAFDPDGKIGSGLDVGMTFLATDSNNKEVGFFDSTTSLLPNGAGKKVKWTASVTGSQTTRTADGNYTLTVNGFDEKNNTFSVQFKVKVQATGTAKLKGN